ncbi:MAG: polysaccharide deacetylase family protein [Firmicutes bacterium]|nr:polysaccharide deacetylase family protein [Bacillota bacterium]MDD4264628.1 polysaccharide deacetylase family protein [Bacillota bacterium]MDD4693227.1 polysaccharide deacetylase family protein [Bacillota bacterium]
MRYFKFLLVFVLVVLIGFRILAIDDKKIAQNPIKESSRATKKIALTFDDGPNRACTPALLRILEDENVKATFFVVGWRVYEFKDVIATMSKNGHEIGNHSYDHPYLTHLSEAEIADQLRKTNAAILKYSGKKVNFLRPPYGSYNDLVSKTASDLGLRMVLWSINPEDWKSPGTDVIQKRILEEAKDGSIVLLHDKLQTVQMLPNLIQSLKDRGFEFVTLQELHTGSLL